MGLGGSTPAGTDVPGDLPPHTQRHRVRVAERRSVGVHLMFPGIVSTDYPRVIEVSVTASHSCESSMPDGGPSRSSMASWTNPLAMPGVMQTAGVEAAGHYHRPMLNSPWHAGASQVGLS
jgi:hypothetical protein